MYSLLGGAVSFLVVDNPAIVVEAVKMVKKQSSNTHYSDIQISLYPVN